MSTETQTGLVVIDPKEYGLEPVKASEMTSGLNSIIEERTALESIFNDLILKELNPETLKEARDLRLKVQKNRTQGIQIWHKTNKEFYLAGGRFVDAVKNKEVAINERMESKLDDIENHFKVLEENRLTQLKADRVALLEPFGEVNPFFDLKAMDEVTFNNLLADTKLAYETRRENERKAEEQRIADEKKAEQERIDTEKKAESERLEKEKLIKHRTKLLTDAGISFDGEIFFIGDTLIIDLDSIHEKTEEVFERLLNAGIKKIEAIKSERERIEAENEKLRLDNEAKEKELAKEREIQEQKNKRAKELAPFINYISDYDKLINSSEEDFNKEVDEMSKAFLLQQKYDADKLEEERKIQANKDAEIKRLKEEKEAEQIRLQNEENDRIAKEKAALLAPERDKVKSFFEKFEELRKSFPELTSEEGIALAKNVAESMMLVRGIIINESKNLL